MRFEFAPSFDRSIKKLDFLRKRKIKQSIIKCIDFFETKTKPESLGLKHLRNNYWEIRVTIKDRIILNITDDLVKFIITGSHDDIKNFLKHI